MTPQTSLDYRFTGRNANHGCRSFPSSTLQRVHFLNTATLLSAGPQG